MALDHGHASTAARELPGADEAGGAGAHHGHARRVLPRRSEASRATVRPLPIADGALVVVNRLRLVRTAQVTGRLAQRRTHPARELGHGRGQRQTLGCILPLTTIDEVVPLGNEVVQGATTRARLAKRDARLAEGHAAHHATARLHLLLLGRKQLVELVVVTRTLGHVTKPMGLPAVLEKRSWLAHASSSP